STPTGTITWSTSATGGSAGSASFSSSTCSLTGSGQSASCSVTYTATSTGNASSNPHTITAAYGGDAKHAPSSGITPVTINGLPATTLTVAAATGPLDGTVDLSATLKSGSTLLSGKPISFTLHG